MLIKKVSLSQINPAPYNSRVDLTPEDPEYQKLDRSIKNFGYVDPIIWNCQTGNLVGGHQRLKILVAQGLTEIDVSVVDLSLIKEKALNLALNKIGNKWDDDKLSPILDELNNCSEIDILLTGFDLPEISEILDRSIESEDDDFDFDDAIKDIEESVTQEGNLIELGDHRILCGDSSSADDIKLLLGEEKINLIHSDPPYNVSYYGGDRPNKKSRPSNHKLWDRIYSDDMSQDDYEKWLKTIVSNISPYLAEGAPVYIWNGHRQFGPMHQMLTDLDFHISCVITWAKEQFAFGHGDYHQKTEFCLYGWKKENGAHIWYGPNNENTLWEIHRDPTKNYIHPTQKPMAIPQRAIKNSSKRGDIVLDMFLGSGSTLIAAESLGRRCLGLEIDPKYCDGIVKRYIAFVGIDNVSKKIREKYAETTHENDKR